MATYSLPVMRTRNDLRRLPVMRLAQDGGPATLVDPSEDNPSARSLPGYAPAPAVGEVISRAPGAESAALPSDSAPPQAGAMRADAYADSLPTINPAYASKFEGTAPSPYEKAVADYNALLAASPVNTNSRGAGALRMAADASRREAQQSNSLGRVLGAAIGGGVTGLLDKSADERAIDRPVQLARAQAAVQGAAALEQEQSRKRQEADESALRQAQIRHTNVETEELPKMNEDKRQQSAQTRLLQQIRTQGSYKRGANPALDSQLDSAGMSVSDFDKGGKFQWKEAGGQVYTMDANSGRVNYATVGGDDGQPATPIVDRSKMPNADGLTPNQAMTFSDRAAERAQRKQIATERSALEGQRNSLSRDQFNEKQREFQSTHPGLGRSLKKSDIEAEQAKENAAALKDARNPRNLRMEAVRQGYAIDDNN